MDVWQFCGDSLATDDAICGIGAAGVAVGCWVGEVSQFVAVGGYDGDWVGVTAATGAVADAAEYGDFGGNGDGVLWANCVFGGCSASFGSFSVEYVEFVAVTPGSDAVGGNVGVVGRLDGAGSRSGYCFAVEFGDGDDWGTDCDSCDSATGESSLMIGISLSLDRVRFLSGDRCVWERY